MDDYSMQNFPTVHLQIGWAEAYIIVSFHDALFRSRLSHHAVEVLLLLKLCMIKNRGKASCILPMTKH